MPSQLFCAARRRKWGILCAFVLPLGVSAAFRTPPLPTQAQVARRFLLEILRAEYPAAYQRLAPEVRAAIPLASFERAARPLWQQGQASGAAIELYQIGARLGGAGRPNQWFCRFAFASDSARRPPPVLLEVMFRDTAARAVLGFDVRRR
jgi:hypothetical protein